MRNFKLLYVGLAMLLSIQSFSQSINTEKTIGNRTILLGKINKEKLSSQPYADWFIKTYEEYLPDRTIIKNLEGKLDSYRITVFMGSWCGDSKREVPKLYRILDETNFPLDRLTTVAVNYERNQYKKSPGGEQEGLNIHRVPTIILYKNGKEINRIVESPKTTLEKDIQNILSHNYQSKYESVSYIHSMIQNNNSDHLIQKSKKHLKHLKDKTESMYELNTYAKTLLLNNQKEEAIVVLQFNTLLFPKEANTYVSLGNVLFSVSEPKRALEFYKKSLIHAKNDEIENKIQQIERSLQEG